MSISFRGSDADNVSHLLARGDYKRAIVSVRNQLARDTSNVFLRQTLADALIATGEREEPFRMLHQLADDFAREGFAAKAIAILKKMDRVDPGRSDVYEKLAAIIPRKEEQDDVLRHRRSLYRRHTEELQFSSPPEPRREEQHEEDGEMTFDIDGDFIPEPMSERSGLTPSVVTTPLFESLAEAELMSLMRGLQLLSFTPGDIIVAEGERDARLFIVTKGRVKAFVKNEEGQHKMVREHIDGDFFGEISLLTGEPRTATVTAAAPTDLLVLDKQTADSVAAEHPHFHEVLERFSRQRLRSPEELRARGRAPEESAR